MSDAPTVDVVDAGDPVSIASAVVERFRSEHGRVPDGVWAAPGRVNLIGEHTDYNSGLCLPIALPHATYAAIGLRPDGGVTASSDRAGDRFEGSADDLGPGRATGWASYVGGVVWAARRAGIEVPGLDIVLTSTVPVGAGLSSSAALECSVAVGMCELAGLDVDQALRRRLVDICGAAEREVAGAPTGGMDQTISLLATAGHGLLLDFDDGSVTNVRWQPEHDDVQLIVVDTGVRHALSDGGYAARRDSCERAARSLGVRSLREVDLDVLERLRDPLLERRARHVVTEIERVRAAVDAIRDADWPRLGRIFDASHASLRDDFEVSCTELDVVCQAAHRSGALGARMTGGGFGGSAIVLVPTSSSSDLRRTVATEFERRGWARPRFLAGRASAGARALRSP